MLIALASLFVSALVAATILPGASELLFTQQLFERPEAWLWLWLAVTAGNALGGAITFYMGVGIGRLGQHWHWAQKLRMQAPKPELMAKVQHYGSWSLLFTWLPVIGDGLCLAAGMLGWSRWRSLLLIALGKAARYAAIAWLVL